MKNNNYEYKSSNHIPEYSKTPSPEEIYIRLETYFIGVLNRYRESANNYQKIKDILTAYKLLNGTDFKFSHIMPLYEKIIFDELGYKNLLHWEYKAYGYFRHNMAEAIFARDNYKCLCCGTTEDLTLDHILARHLGGWNKPDNLQTLCKSCNSIKDIQVIDYRGTDIPKNKEMLKKINKKIKTIIPFA